MKGALLLVAVFALSMLVIPMLAVGDGGAAPPESSSTAPAGAWPAQALETPYAPAVSAAPFTGGSAAASIPPGPPAAPAGGEAEASANSGEGGYPRAGTAGVEAFRVLDESTGEVHTVPVADYVRGAVAAEMPAAFHSEALKAQAVAAHTYALYHHYMQERRPDPALRGADFAGDPSNMKVYITEEMAREFYGDRAGEYWQKICDAADSVSHLALEYAGEPIVAAYHAMSAGMTESAANVWVGEAPYLVPVQSEGDYLAPDYETEARFTNSELQTLLTAAFPGITLSEDAGEWFGEAVRSPSGYVLGIEVGDRAVHGSEIRAALGLRSHAFESFATDDGGWLFVVYGYGHGVGLSQYGADFMARQGATFDEILAGYYTGAKIVTVSG